MLATNHTMIIKKCFESKNKMKKSGAIWQKRIPRTRRGKIETKSNPNLTTEGAEGAVVQLLTIPYFLTR